MPDVPSRNSSLSLRSLAVAAGLIATFAIDSAYGYWAMFSGFRDYDDEGCMLISIRAFNEGHALYDEVFSMYGPFPFLVKWCLFSALRRPVGHDVGRLICLGYWLATATACGGVAWRLTRSVLAGWAGFVLTFQALGMIIHEPGHPQELCGLLLAVAAFSATFAEPGRRLGPIMGGLGVLAGCLALSKINVSIFFAMALGAAMLASTPRTAAIRVLLVLYVLCLLAAPGMLMRSLLDDPRVSAFALHVTLSLIPALLLGFGVRRPAFLGARHYAWAVGASAFATAAIAGVVLMRGTTPHGLLEGILLIPLRNGFTFSVLHTWFQDRWPIAASFGAGVAAWVVLHREGLASRPLPAVLFAAFRIAYGVYCLELTRQMRFEQFDRLLVFGLPAAGLLCPRDVAARPAGDSFGRLFLAFLAVTESLWAFPVAGAQLSFSSFLTALAMVVLVADGCRDLGLALDLRGRYGTVVLSRLVRAGIVASLLSPVFVATRDARALYLRNVPLGLPGAKLIRLDPQSVGHYRRLTKVLRARPDTFFSMPGMNSLYFWADRRPPTGHNLTSWMNVLDGPRQAQILERLGARPEICVVVCPSLIQFWLKGGPLPTSPLIRSIETDFVPSMSFEGITILVRKPPARPQGSRSP